jgi:hypothetical protein
MKKQDLEYELRAANFDILRLRDEVSDWARRYDIQNAALVDRDAKIKVLINALAIATRSMVIAPEDALT